MTSQTPETGSILMGMTPAPAPVEAQTVHAAAEVPEAHFMPATPEPETLPDVAAEQRTAPVDSPVQTVASRLRAIADELEAL
jgi:hypothetical protein